MPFAGVTLADLNGFMKNYATGTIVPQEYFWNSLDDILKADITSSGFIGDCAELLIQTGFPFTGQAFGEDVDIPQPDDLGFVRQYIPLKQIVVNAGLTKQALDRATGGNSSWGRIVDLVLRAQRTEFLWLRELCRIGDGTGRLARLNDTAVSGNGSAGAPYVCTCDNTYADWGWENTYLMKVGMKVDIYNEDGTLVLAGGVVSAVAPGNRDNGAATTGTVSVVGTLESGGNFTNSGGAADGYVIFLANTYKLGLTDTTVAFGATSANGHPGTVYEATNMLNTGDVRTSLPMGLAGIIQSTTAGRTFTDGAIDCTLDTFQGLARASYPNLSAQIYQGADFGGTDGTPSDWDLSVISDAINQTERDTGGKTDVLLCSSELAMAIHRRNRSESNITVNVSSTSGENQNAVGAQFAAKFLCPDGRVIPIKVSKTVPRNVLKGLCTEDLKWFTMGDFDFLKLNGEIWDKSYDDRKANFEAPFGGYEQLGAERCDRQWEIQDMKDNI